MHCIGKLVSPHRQCLQYDVIWWITCVWSHTCRRAGIDEVQIRARGLSRPLGWRHGQASGSGVTCADSQTTHVPDVSFLPTNSATQPAALWPHRQLEWAFLLRARPQRVQEVVSDDYQLRLQGHFRHRRSADAIADLCHPVGKRRKRLCCRQGTCADDQTSFAPRQAAMGGRIFAHALLKLGRCVCARARDRGLESNE